MRKSAKGRRARHGVPKKAATASARPDREHGEGNYKAAREYDRATGAFVKSGKVAPAARAARPRSRGEAAEMERAEAEGRSRSKGEDTPVRTHR